jgi:general secretion pathway protein A
MIERILEATSSSTFGFFGLRENPFGTNPNPRFLYLTPLIQAASQQLVEGIRNRKGLILLTGDVGTGKTLLLRRLLDWLAQQKVPTALIFNSHVNPDHLLDLILSDFGVPCESRFISDKLVSLNRWLVGRYRLGQTPVLIVDEAQGLPRHTLEAIRLLQNLETRCEKLLQIILAGQPELEEKLKRHECRQLRQRITVRCRTAPLTLQETQAYIEQRLRIAGASEPIFQPGAAAFVYAYSQGVLRVVNLLCENSLINARAEGSRTVSPQFVERAAHDCQLDQGAAVSHATNSSDPAGASLAEISSILAEMSLPGSALPSKAYSADSSVPTEAPPAAIDSEVHVPMRDSSSGEAATILEDLPQECDLRVYQVAMVVTENPTVLASTLRKADAPPSKCASSANAVQTRGSAPPSPVRNPRPRTGFSHRTISLFQAWWRSFSADAHSTWRQLRRLRAQVLKFGAIRTGIALTKSSRSELR